MRCVILPERSESETFILLNVPVLHDELGIVMAKTWQQLPGSPLQEVVEGVRGTLLHPDLVSVTPDLQTGQRHPYVQRTVELEQREERQLGSGVTEDLHQFVGTGGVSHPVHLVGHIQHAVDDGGVVLLVVQKL